LTFLFFFAFVFIFFDVFQNTTNSRPRITLFTKNDPFLRFTKRLDSVKLNKYFFSVVRTAREDVLCARRVDIRAYIEGFFWREREL